MVSLDLETTSADPFTARIVTAAIALVGGDQPTEQWTVLADPGVEIPAEATAIHGISTERARAEGCEAGMAVAGVLAYLELHAPGKALIVFRAPFDLTVVEQEARRHGLVPLTQRFPLQVVDPSTIDRHLDRYRPGSRKLAALCQHYGARMDQAHDAAFDAIAAARVAYVLGKWADVVRRVRDHNEAVELLALRRTWDAVRGDLPALHAAQVEWARLQAEGLEDHFERSGKSQHVPRDWPVLSLPERVA
jgi:DNA polymerase-3 subunit epsilon